MPSSLNVRRLGFVTGLFVLALFQNCSDSGDDTSFDTQSSVESGLPFAYDAKIDTLAYMSCSEMQEGTYEPRAYFSFRAGAYSSATGGLGQTPTFRSATQYYTNTNRANALAESDNNSNTLLNLSIRDRSNFQSIWATDGVTAGHEIDSFLPNSLDGVDTAGTFASSNIGQYINYFPGDQDVRLMEASLRFLNFENVANDTRNNLGGQSSILVVGFSKTADALDATLRTPLDFPSPQTPLPTPAPATNTNAQAFGVGFLVPFGLPAGYQSGDRRVLDPNVGLQEIDLTTNQIKPSSWDCSSNYEFMVIRPEDLLAGIIACNAGVDRPAPGAQTAALNAIRRVLRVEDWFVDLVDHCVIPKHTGDLCYGSTFGTRTISYGIANCVDSATTSCPHFVSVCIRN